MLLQRWREEIYFNISTAAEINRRIDGLRFIDEHRQAWIPGFVSGRWYRFEEGQWICREPPAWLELADNPALSPMAPVAAPPPAVATLPIQHQAPQPSVNQATLPIQHASPQ